MTFYFPDISYFEPNADIEAILKQSGGVIGLRAAYGVGFRDVKFAAWRDRARGAKAVLIYQFVVKSGSYSGSVAENADYFAKIVGKLRANEVPVIDVEGKSGSWSKADVEKWRTLVQQKCGGPKALVYANQSYAHEHNLEALFTTSKGWVAKYGSPGHDASAPDVKYIAWQHAADGYGKPRVHWAGCPTDTDENRVEVSMAAFLTAVFDGKAKPAVADYWDVKPTGGRYDGKYDGRVRVPWGTHYEGQSGERVNNLQDALNVYYKANKLKVDGDYGPATKALVKAFQSKNKDENGNALVQDGIYNNHTARSLALRLGVPKAAV